MALNFGDSNNNEDTKQHVDAEDTLTVSGVIQSTFDPVEVTTEGDKIFKVSCPTFGYSLVIQLPWWISNPHLVRWEGDRRLNLITACDRVHGAAVLVMVSCLSDRRGEPRMVEHEELLRHFCDVNWFSDSTLAMYYTDHPSTGMQTYTVVAKDASVGSRFHHSQILSEYRDLCSHYHKAKCSQMLSPVCYEVFGELINYFSKFNISSSRQLKSTVHRQGLALLRKLFVCQELIQPSPVRSLTRMCVIATALYIQDPARAGSLRLPIPVYEEVESVLCMLVAESKISPSVRVVSTPTPLPLFNE